MGRRRTRLDGCAGKARVSEHLGQVREMFGAKSFRKVQNLAS